MYDEANMYTMAGPHLYEGGFGELPVWGLCLQLVIICTTLLIITALHKHQVQDCTFLLEER